MARVVLSVGCGNYDNGDRLPGAINDARDFFRVMLDEQLGGASPMNSILLPDPTAPQLLEEMSSFFSRLTASDEYFLFFAGHAHRAKTGYTFRCRNTPPKSAFDSFSWRELKLLTSKTAARGTLIFDTCYSGAIESLAEYLSRGEQDDQEESPPPEAPREGSVVIWSCDSENRAFENKEHGVFSELFLEGIRGGANSRTDEQYVTAGTLVSYVIDRLVSKKHKGSYPKSRDSGDIAGMFVSKNPRFTIGSDDALSSLSQSVLERNKILSERSCKGIQELVRSILRQETKLLPRRSATPHALQARLFFIPTLGTEVYFSHVSDSTVLITENGFYRLAGTESITFVWEAVENVETFTDSTNTVFKSWSHENVTINFRPAVAAEKKIKHYVITDNKHLLLGQAIEWGRTYKKGRWKWNVLAPKPPVRGREIAMFAPLTYESMRTIRASANDVSAIAGSFHAVAPAYNPATATEFKTSLRAVFQSAGHKTLIIYYSGHGVVLEGELFLTAQFSVSAHPLETAVPIFKLLDLMTEYQVINLILILDCCYSGAAGDNLGVSFDALDPSLETLFDADQNGISIIASSGRSEESFDTPTQSVFTGAIVQGCSIARLKKSRVTVGDLISAIPKVMSDRDQRMRVFVSQQGQEVVLADEHEDAATSELAAIAIRQNLKADQVSKLEYIDFRLLQDRHFASEDVRLFRKGPVSLRSRIFGLPLALLALLSALSAPEMMIEEHSWTTWIIAPLVAVFGLFTFGLPAWIILTDTDKDHYMVLADSGVLIREGSDCKIVPAASLMSIQTGRSHEVHVFKGAISDREITRHVLVLDDGKPVELPYWLDSSTDLAIKCVNELIDPTSKTVASSEHRATSTQPDR